jgi:predicted CopG family antitoxin
METTTIAIRKDLKDRILEFAMKKETYSDVIERLLQSAEQRLLNDILMSKEGFIPIEDAIKRAEKKWKK